MSKCGICGKELLTGDLHWVIGICNNCYNKIYKSDEQKYVDMLHKENSELLVNSLAEKDKQIAELQKQLEEKEKEIEDLRKIHSIKDDVSQCEVVNGVKFFNEQIMIIQILKHNYEMQINNLKQQLKSQPKEIIQEIKEKAQYGVFECKVDYTITEELLDTILKEYDN